jgi:hypothetical protein
MFFTSFAFAKPYKVKVFTEPAAEDRAREYISNMKALEPFKQLIEQKALIVESSPTIVTGLNCRGGNYGIPRLAQCDLDSVRESCGDADLCPVYTGVPDIGAGAQRFPIVSSSFPWTTMLHEVVHTFGFTDEYAYTMKETGIYCPGVLNWQNGHTRNSKEVFSTKELAENFCKKIISWCQLAIDSGTPVVQKTEDGKYRIGSPTPKSCPDVTLGVYPGGSCQAKNPNGTWRPYFCPTVMGYPALGEDYCSVTKRHKIILNSPNLLPEYYQRRIFKRIAPELLFVNRKLPDLSPHTYGLPEIDRLTNENAETNHCSQNELMNFGDWPHGH